MVDTFSAGSKYNHIVKKLYEITIWNSYID